MIKRGEVNFNFYTDEYFSEKVITVKGLTPSNFISVVTLPESNLDHDLDDFLVEQVTTGIKKINKDSITLVATAPESASGIYKFNYIITYAN